MAVLALDKLRSTGEQFVHAGFAHHLLHCSKAGWIGYPTSWRSAKLPSVLMGWHLFKAPTNSSTRIGLLR
jgi:hypothetical protein